MGRTKLYKDITGLRFGSLIAIHYCYTRKGLAYWLYKCDCGKEHIARANTITYEAKKATSPNLPSCGCVELANKTKHGYRKVKDTHPLYRAYRGIMSRCYNLKDPNYIFYGLKGVTICDEWKGNPVAFIEWGLANGWKKGLTIDKDILCQKYNIYPQIYSPKTCMFIDMASNTRYSRGRHRKGIDKRIRIDWNDCKDLYNRFLNHTYPSDNQFHIAMMKEYNVKSTSAISKAIKSYQKYIQSNDLNEHKD